MEEKRLNEELKGFVNWFLFDDRKLIKEFYCRLSLLLKLCNIIKENFSSYNDEKINLSNLTENNFFSKINLITSFFESINVNIDINKLINEGYIEPKYLDRKETENNQKKYLNCHCKDLGNDNYDILISESNFTLDSIITVHEIGHYLSKTYDESSVYNFFSEVPSMYLELLYYDYLENTGYSEDAEEFEKIRFSRLKHIAAEYTPVIKILDVYFTFGQLSRENYNKLYNDDYLDVLHSIDNVDKLYSLKQKLQYVVGFFVSIIMRKKFKEDFSYCVNFDNFNKNIGILDFEQVLKILDINLFDNISMNEFEKYVEEYREEKKQHYLK